MANPPPPELGGLGEIMAELAVPRGSAVNCSANAAMGVYYNIGPLSKFDHQRYPPVGVEIPHGPRHGLSVPGTSAFELNMAVQYL